MRGRVRHFVAMCALAASVRCSQQSASSVPDKATRPRDGGTLHLAQDAPDRLDPACVDDAYEASLVNQIFDGLLAFDTHLNTVPGIASSWVISPDGTVYTFELRAGVPFHDGSEVTADDVVFSLRRVFDLPEHETGLARAYLGHILGSREYAEHRTKQLRGLEALSPHQVRITLEHPYAPFLAVLASEMARIVPKHVVEQVGNEAFARQPVGSGPFRLARWVPNQSIVLTAFRAPNTAHVYLDSIVIDLPQGNVREYAPRQFMAGHLSAVVVPDGRLFDFKGHPNWHVVSRQELSLTFLALNPHQPPFNDIRVRRAFALALDRKAILGRETGARIPPNGILPPGIPGYSPESKLLPHDAVTAKQLLAAAGHPGGRGLSPVRLTLAMTSAQGRALLEQVRAQLAAVGFRVQLQELPWREFSPLLNDHSLQCLNVTWTADIPDPDSFLYPMCASDGSGNFVGYSNPAVDALLLRGRSTRSSIERLEIYRDAERRILQDATLIPLFHPLGAIAVQEYVHDFTFSAMGWASMPLEHVWLSNGAVGVEPMASGVRITPATLEGRIQ